jgi:expansin (peptidoglycan-binding protein)
MQRLTAFVLTAVLFGYGRPTWAAACDQTLHDGHATFYDFADGTGVCGYPAETGHQMVVALDTEELANTALCGACIHIWGPAAEATVLVVNGCPGCEVGHLDLSPEAYDIVAADYNGVPPITWQYVPCDVSGPIRYAYYSGSSTNFAWVQVRNQRYPIAKFEVLMADGDYVELEAGGWGYYKAENLPAGSQSYRVTDIYGQVLEDTGIAVLDEGEVDGSEQFPMCTGSSDAGSDDAAGGSGPASDHDAAPGEQQGAAGLGADSGAAEEDASTEDGCGCRIVAPRHGRAGAWLVLILAALGRRAAKRRASGR